MALHEKPQSSNTQAGYDVHLFGTCFPFCGFLINHKGNEGSEGVRLSVERGLAWEGHPGWKGPSQGVALSAWRGRPGKGSASRVVSSAALCCGCVGGEERCGLPGNTEFCASLPSAQGMKGLEMEHNDPFSS